MQVNLFLHCIGNEGSSMSTIQKLAGQSGGAGSRNMRMLADGNGKLPGYKLISLDRDPHDDRYKVVRFTEKGRELIEKIKAV